MPQDGKTSGLLTLPWELRSVIFLDVLKHSRGREPIFDNKLIKNRVRLRNCFDGRGPEHTNIYIEKPRRRYMHAHALLATNRQLRREITVLVIEELKTGRVKIPFVLDIMYVKDVGVFPTWMSFPYQTKRIVRLRVNIRIVRPDASIIPDEWIEAARYQPADHSGMGVKLSAWNLFFVLALYPLSRFSIKFKPGSGRISQFSEEHGTTLHGAIQQDAPANAMKIRHQYQARRALKESCIRHKSDVADAHLIPIESTPYVVDDLFIDMKSFEYQADGKTITTELEDTPKKSQFYREGYVQFGRDIFLDFNPRWMDSDDIEFELRDRASGRISSEQLQHEIWESCFAHIRGTHTHILGLCNDVLANSVGGISISRADNFETIIIYKGTEHWFHPWEDDLWFGKRRMKQEIATQEVMEYPNFEDIEQLRTMMRRTNLGWPARHTEWLERLEKSSGDKVALHSNTFY